MISYSLIFGTGYSPMQKRTVEVFTATAAAVIHCYDEFTIKKN